MDDVGGDHAQKDDGRRQHVQLHAAFLERREEAGSHLQADRVDEQNQPELFDEMDQMLVELHPEMAERDSDEKNPRHAEPDSADFELAERDAERDHQRENQHRVGDASAPERAVAEKKIMKPFHIKKCTDRLFRWSGLESLAGGAGVADGRACPDSGCEGTKLSGTCGCRIVRGALFIKKILNIWGASVSTRSDPARAAFAGEKGMVSAGSGVSRLSCPVRRAVFRVLRAGAEPVPPFGQCAARLRSGRFGLGRRSLRSATGASLSKSGPCSVRLPAG